MHKRTVQTKEIVTPAEAAKLLGKSVRTIYRYIENGNVTAYRQNGGWNLFLVKSDLLKLSGTSGEPPQNNNNPRETDWLSLSEIKRWEPLAQQLGVSEVARSSRGFLTQYKNAGSKKAVSGIWQQKREAFIARHMAQINQRNEPLFEDGLPTRRHLALIMWAYSPSPSKIKKIRQNLQDN